MTNSSLRVGLITTAHLCDVPPLLAFPNEIAATGSVRAKLKRDRCIIATPRRRKERTVRFRCSFEIATKNKDFVLHKKKKGRAKNRTN